MDQDNRRLSLGHKQIEENPWDEYESLFTVGSVHEGTVKAFVDRALPSLWSMALKVMLQPGTL